MERYQRQLLLPELGYEGQEKLANGKVALIGVGGLGGTCAIYLTVAGVAEKEGKLTLIDFDKVSISNLNRQILYSEKDIAQLKVKVATEKLQAYNQQIHIQPYTNKISSQNIHQLLKDSDIIIDAGDNFSLTYLLNDYAKKMQKPFISASVEGTKGYISVSCYSTATQQNLPSLRAIFPNPPDTSQQLKPIPIIGTTAGTFGLLLAQECIKVLLQDKSQLAGKLLSLDLWNYHQNIIDFSESKE